MKLILSIFFITILFITTIHFQSIAQGCMAVCSTGNINMLHPDENEKAAWPLCTTSRSFKSFRHFSGTEENKQRLIKGAEVMNLQTRLDILLPHMVNNCWFFMRDATILSTDRSALHKHELVFGVYIKDEKHTTHFYGIGDIRFAAYRWLLYATKNSKENIKAGLEIKFPTDNDNLRNCCYDKGLNRTKEMRAFINLI